MDCKHAVGGGEPFVVCKLSPLHKLLESVAGFIVSTAFPKIVNEYNMICVNIEPTFFFFLSLHCWIPLRSLPFHTDCRLIYFRYFFFVSAWIIPFARVHLCQNSLQLAKSEAQSCMKPVLFCKAVLLLFSEKCVWDPSSFYVMAAI